MRKKVYFLLVLVLCLFFVSCKSEDTNTVEQKTDADESEIVEQDDNQNNIVEESNSDSIDDSLENVDDEDSEEDILESDDDLIQEEDIVLYTVGEERYGYVDIPTDWVKFLDLDGGTGIAYSTIDGACVITLDLFDLSGLTEEQAAQIDAEILAQNVWYNLEQDNVEDIEGAKVTLDGYDAFQIYGDYENDSSVLCVIVCWVFEDDNGLNHFVSVEGPFDDIMKAFNYVESSYRVDN